LRHGRREKGGADERVPPVSEREGDGTALLGWEVGSGFCWAAAGLGRGREGRGGGVELGPEERGESWACGWG